jgi:hypothetical protein
MSVAENIEAAHAVLQNRTAAAATLRIAADQARLAVREIDLENEESPAREAEILARMAAGTSIAETFSALGRLDDAAIARCWQRKIAVALAAQLDERRLHARAQRESQLEALFARTASAAE